jgi:hypothetical protein
MASQRAVRSIHRAGCPHAGFSQAFKYFGRKNLPHDAVVENMTTESFGEIHYGASENQNIVV